MQKKCAAIPPVVINSPRLSCAQRSPPANQLLKSESTKAGSQQHHPVSDDTTPTELVYAVASNNYKLPLINPHDGELNYLHPQSVALPGGSAQDSGTVVRSTPHSFSIDTILGHRKAGVESTTAWGHSLTATHPPLAASNVPPSSIVANDSSALRQQSPIQAPCSGAVVRSNKCFSIDTILGHHKTGAELPKPLMSPSKISPLSLSALGSSGGFHQSQLPNGINMPGHLATTPNHLLAQSPAYSNTSSMCSAPQSPFSYAFSMSTSGKDQPLSMADSLSEEEPCICLWEGCGQICDHHRDFVRHIENAHTMSGDLICLWQDCDRKRNPFSTKYTLRDHMHRHSREKPEQCIVSYCTAFMHASNFP